MARDGAGAVAQTCHRAAARAGAGAGRRRRAADPAWRSAGVDVDVDGSLAHTVIDLTLANPNARVLEGELQFPLHAGQTVTGFALDMADGTMRPAVPVPKARGRQVFEEVVRRGVDPALLEQTTGENFRLRVYPLRPHGTRRVRIAIDQWLTPDARRRLGLALPLDFAGTRADQLDVHVHLHATDPSGVRLGGALEHATVHGRGRGQRHHAARRRRTPVRAARPRAST